MANKITVSFISAGSNFLTPKTINSGTAPGNPGTPSRGGSNPSYTFVGWTTTNPGSNGVYTGQTFLTSAQVGSNTLTSNTTYYALYRLNASSQNNSLNVSASSGGNAIGSSLRSAIHTKVSGVTGTTFTSVRFTSLSTSTYGQLYTTSSKGTYVSTGIDYSYNDVNSFYFVPTTRTSFSLNYTAKDSGGNTVSGTITLNVSGSAYAGKTITYKVAAGDTVSFSRADFQNAYKEFYSGTIDYITLETSDNLNTSDGAVYYSYGTKSEERFTKSTIDDHAYYYNASRGDYAINDLSFYAPKGAGKRTVELHYVAYYSSSQYVEGVVEIKVGGTTSKKGDITYEVNPGKEVSFDADDFYDFFHAEYSSYDLRYVTFETSDTLSTSVGTVYFKYGRSGEKSFTKSSISSSKFYYDDSDYGEYDLDALSFYVPKSAEERTVELRFTAYYSSSRNVSGTLVIVIGDGGSSSKKGDITYDVDPGKEVSFDAEDFYDFFHAEYSSYDLRYVTFETSDTLSTSVGTVYSKYGRSGEKSFTKSTISSSKFYYDDSDYGEYDLDDLSFYVPKGASDRSVELRFTAYYSSSRNVSGTLVINIGDGDAANTKKGDITYQTAPGEEVSFNRGDFNTYFRKEYSGYSLRYVTFETDDTLSKSVGLIYSGYDTKSEKSFTHKTIDGENFYYSDDSYGDYALDDLSFVAGDDFTKPITLEFRAYYDKERYVDGTLVINPEGTTGDGKGDIRYYTTYSTDVQINPNDIARFFKKTYPSYTLQYVEFENVPSSGTLYYNYYGVSKYGSSTRKALTSSNCGDQSFYFSPTSTSQYSLGELTYVPNGINYCATIPFTAYSTSARSVKGVILISVNMKTTPEVYGATLKNASVTFPHTALYSAVSSATNGASTLASIQLLELPASSVGTIYVGSGTSTKATTTDRYSYSSGSQQISQLRFVPASGFTGSVEIPYLAYNSSGNAIAGGKFCLGVVGSKKTFSDVNSSTWCYKYVVELSDAKVIDGYTNGTFRPDNTVTYGQALKLIMLAAGYSVQNPTGAHPFSGYLDKAKADGLISGAVNLDAPITRLAVAQIAAKALDLSTSGLSSVKPFTDTSDAYVQALNAAGVVEGYFSNGTSAYKPGNTLTRGQISAIVWRMNQLDK